ncbi:MAG: ATP-dependent Clp protease proteolytic subunit [Planctomycetes bacterium]|nr:ATP-dependent Clp protease proteolytic subunit [Planctomycetota bacterium]
MTRCTLRPNAAARRAAATCCGRAAVVACLLMACGISAGAGELRGNAIAVVIPIRGEINDILADSIERRLEEARAAGAKTIIFEMDTPGGMVTSALDICRMIKSLPDDIHTVAWVNPNAYSAGAMISVACNQILMSRSSAIGDCAPILISPGGGLQEIGETNRAKIESPVLQEFRDSAAINGHDALLCRAMVTVGEEVWWVEDAESGQRKFVTTDEKDELLGTSEKNLFDDPDEDRDASESKEETPQTGWRLVKSYDDPISGNAVPVRQPIDRKDGLLTLSQSEAVAFGLARAIATDVKAVASHLQIDSLPVHIDISGWEKFVMWLNSPLVRGILFVIVLLGGYIEFQNPGLIIPGATAAVALCIFLGAPYAAGLADIWTIVLLVIGLGLLALEIFVLPGFGIAGICGLLLILVAFVGTFVPAEPNMPAFSWPEMEGTWTALKKGVIVLTSSMVIAVMGIMLLARYLHELPGARHLILSTPDGAALALSDPYPDIALPGDVGTVVAPLRPGGQARFGTRVVEVRSQGGFVETDRAVQVLSREGPNIIVRPLPEDA